MIKTISVYSIPEGTDPEEFWRYHTEVHARDVVKAAGPTLKRYVINRVVKARSGEPKFWGVIEMWWESEEARESYNERAKLVRAATGKTPPEDFNARVVPGASFGAYVEEMVIPTGVE